MAKKGNSPKKAKLTLPAANKGNEADKLIGRTPSGRHHGDDKLDPADQRPPEVGFRTQSMVENAAMPFGHLTTWEAFSQMRNALWATLIGAYAGFLFGLDQGYIGPLLSMDEFKETFGERKGNSYQISDSISGLIVSIFAVGAFIAASPIISSWFVDGLGRKWSIAVGGFVFAIGAVIQSTSAHLAQFLIGRFVGGAAIGVLCTVVPIYQSEVSPKETRGLNGSTFQLMIVSGIVVAAIIDKFLDSVHNGWKICIYPQIACGVLLIILSFFMYESPRYLMVKGKEEQAKKVLFALRKGAPDGYAELEWEDMVDMHESEKNNVSEWKGLFQPFVWRVVLIGMTVNFIQQFTGINAFMYYGSKIGTTIGADGFTVQIIINVANAVFVVPALFMVDKMGRTFLLKWGNLLMFLTLAIGAVVGDTMIKTPHDGCYKTGWVACVCTDQTDWDNSRWTVDGQTQTLSEYCAAQDGGAGIFKDGVTEDLVQQAMQDSSRVGPDNLKPEYLKYCNPKLFDNNPNVNTTDYSDWASGGDVLSYCSYTKGDQHPVNDGPGNVNKPVGYGIIFLVCAFVAFFEMSWGPLTWVYANEILPQNYRAKGNGMNVVTNWVFVAVVGYMTPALFTSINFNTFLFFAAFNLLGFFFACWLPETAGFPLEKMHWKFERVLGVIYQDGHYTGKTKSLPRDMGRGKDNEKARKQAMKLVATAPGDLSSQMPSDESSQENLA